MARVISPLFLLLMLAAYASLHGHVWEERDLVRAETPADYVIPSKFSRILALGNQGLLSDFLFLKTITFTGGKSVGGKQMGESDWRYFINSIDVVTDLDPYFVDPYFLAEGMLAWDAGKPAEANKILEKGARFRTSDWRLPFFIGFNYFYFMGDQGAGADYIMTAARIPGSPDYFPTLAARLAYYGGKSQTALLFLRQMLAETDNPIMRRRLELRLLALERAVMIEDALTRFNKEWGRMPHKLKELVSAGYLESMPEDPYGGTWGVLENGRVFSSSKFVEEFKDKK